MRRSRSGGNHHSWLLLMFLCSRSLLDSFMLMLVGRVRLVSTMLFVSLFLVTLMMVVRVFHMSMALLVVLLRVKVNSTNNVSVVNMHSLPIW